MVKHILLLSLSILFFTASCFSEDIPFTLEKGFIVVKATAMKDQHIEAVIATGSPHSFVNMDWVLRNKWTPGFTLDKRGETIFLQDVTGIILGDQKPVSIKAKADDGPKTGIGPAAISVKLGREISVRTGSV